MRGILMMAIMAMACVMPVLASDTLVPDSVGADTVRSLRHERHVLKPASPEGGRGVRVVNIEGDTLMLDMPADSIAMLEGLTIVVDTVATPAPIKVFNPDPTRAMWLSVLCPGLGQIYNRRYWKLPIIVGAFVGLSYGTSWNNRMLQDYSRGYRDAMDDDPNTRSYMNFFAPTVKESDLNMDWVQNVMKNKRDYYRRYRDICIFGLVAVYLINVVDAYVDASLSHFDISPDLSLDVRPGTIETTAMVGAGRLPTPAVQCAITF